jgi:hypothetical protein
MFMLAAINGVISSSGSICTDEKIAPAQHRPHVKQSDCDGETMVPSCLGPELSAIFLDIAMTIPLKAVLLLVEETAPPLSLARPQVSLPQG